MTRPVHIADLHEFDTVTISGRASSPEHDFVALRGTVATVDTRHRDDEHDWVKVWPAHGQPDPDGGGKIWFRQDGVTELLLIEDESEPGEPPC